MIGPHLRAFAWLRWKLLNNQWRKGGSVNAVLMTILVFGALALALPSFLACLVLGTYLIPRAAPEHLMYAWDGLVVAFLFFWTIGLMTELQRSEPLPLTKFLYLPVSVHSAFLINYVGSLLRLSIIVFGPVWLAFCLALIAAKGWVMLPVLPLAAAFVLMITALTYQLQGWLGGLMSNPRRRRTVIVGLTAFIVLAAQLPNLVNMLAVGSHNQRQAEQWRAEKQNTEELIRRLNKQEIDIAEFNRRAKEMAENRKRAAEQANREWLDYWRGIIALGNLVLPIGWLPLGVMTAAEGRALPSLLGIMGMTLIGAASLWRSYRVTLRQYRGEATKRRAAPARATAAPGRGTAPGTSMLEARFPGVSEPVAVIALGGLRALLRAPEAKMMLLTPLLMIPIFGMMMLQVGASIPRMVRPLLAFGAMLMVLTGLLQMMANQFGFDRDGFRVYVLSAARRRDILLGKNLAFAPVALTLALVVLGLVQWAFPMRPDLLAAMVPQVVSMYLLFCLLANLLSIVCPYYVAAGALKPASPRLSVVLVQVVCLFTLLPLTQVLTLLPIGIEALFEHLGWTEGVPICLILSLAECVLILLLYRVSLGGLGTLLQSREQRILDTVTHRAV